MNLNEIAENAHRTAITRERNGGAVKIRDILKHTAGEVVEAAQARESWIVDGGDSFSVEHDNYAEELADVVICVLIAAYDDNIDIEAAINSKMQKNAQRAALEGDKMSELNIREKWVYTQRPENERLFLASDMAAALGITAPCFYSLMRSLDLERRIQRDKRGRNVSYFTHDALKRCEEELKRRETEKTITPKKAETTADAAEHPLVIDPRFLELSYFPDVTPECFSEGE